MSRRGWITTILFLTTVGFIVRFGLTFPWSRTFDALRRSDWLLLAGACSINLLSLAAKGAAWYILLRRVAPLRMGTAQLATFAGSAVSCVSVSVSGEAARAQLVHQRDGASFGTIIASLVITRFVEAAGLIIFLSVSLMALPIWRWARLTGMGLAATVLIALIGYRHLPWKRLESRKHGWEYANVIRMVNSSGRAGLAAAVGLTTLSWVAQWLTYHWSIAATHTPLTAAVSLSALVMANIAGIPRLTPGNVGVMQGSIILGMRAFDIPAANALAAGLALQAVQVIPVLALGIAIVGRHGFARLLRAPAPADPVPLAPMTEE